ncbi:hypothetical protein FRAAL5103 [Frankia alni ACN14a]|uniref:Uncharacterized protein n=1 Tax=Frankia alni (strain DSM 45986 / CECT 9034 / ACN14a) TaxID=326424 RepID=Q0RFK0_FRAAA|nr:hypothetical protein FRAAL5103 [Frankia alni ACN14a]
MEHRPGRPAVRTRATRVEVPCGNVRQRPDDAGKPTGRVSDGSSDRPDSKARRDSGADGKNDEGTAYRESSEGSRGPPVWDLGPVSRAGAGIVSRESLLM